jgi:hypothetical protein
LETLPGLRFRSRQKFQDKNVALRYYRNLVEAHAANRLDDPSMREILGAEHFSTLFNHSLRFIPETEIHLLSSTPIGRGRNGEVYRAVWKRPPGQLATANSGEEVDVVLKKMIVNSKARGLSRKFVQEVSTPLP